MNIYNNAKYANVVVLISNNSKCGAIDFAVKNKIDFNKEFDFEKGLILG
jgi:hypothetical protein